jgi:hypothetical protein
MYASKGLIGPSFIAQICQVISLSTIAANKITCYILEVMPLRLLVLMLKAERYFLIATSGQ